MTVSEIKIQETLRKLENKVLIEKLAREKG